MQRYNSSVIGKKATISAASATGIFSLNNIADEQRASNWPAVLPENFDMEILLVGGGGSGGKAGVYDYQSGGGGGGGVILSGTYSYVKGVQLDIVVGAGGSKPVANRGTGGDGSASSIQVNGAGSTYIALARGGGGGCSGSASVATNVGNNGANGGGGYASSSIVLLGS